MNAKTPASIEEAAVLLAEANVCYDQPFDLDAINPTSSTRTWRWSWAPTMW